MVLSQKMDDQWILLIKYYLCVIPRHIPIEAGPNKKMLQFVFYSILGYSFIKKTEKPVGP